MGDSERPVCGVTSWDLTSPLPKLPVPDLTSTLNKYLTLLTPVISEHQLEITRKNVQDFLRRGGVGEKLQNLLLQRQTEEDNWVYNWWLEDMYLKVRLPLPINSNPGMVFPRQRFSGLQQQLSYTTRFICGLLDYKLMIDSGNIPVERCRYLERGQPLCMEQHYRMFSSYRRPGIPQDVQLTDLGKDRTPYIMVACCDQFYKLDLIYDGTQLNEREIYSQLSNIIASAEPDSVDYPAVGVLTSQNRSKWCEARHRLLKGENNAENIDIIENSLLVLCLDKPTLPSCQLQDDDFGADHLADVALHMLHGQGTSANTCNRWFDKTIQIVVSEDGACGMNYEHSVAEGIALVQLVEHALTYISKDNDTRRFLAQDARRLPEPTRLLWTVTSETLEDIRQASEAINALIDNLDFCVMKFDDYGREFPKSQQIGPDAFIQLALQLTYYKVHRRLVMTYESASTRRFRKGRVDNIRANSPVALEWIHAMLGQHDATATEKFALLKKAAKWQETYQTQTILGHGIDCHLLGLREAARVLNVLDSLPLFTDPSFAEAHHFALSTSQVPTSSDSFMCYGPVVPDGYGACYNPFSDYIYFCISSFRECEDTDSRLFTCSLESSLLQMRELCQQGNVPPIS